MAVIDLSTYTVTLNKTLMAENKISASIVRPNTFSYSILDTYVLDGETYKLNRPPKETKGGKNLWRYDLLLESQQYELNRKRFLLDGNREFTIIGDLEFFVDLVLTNINSINSGWTKGSIVSTDDKNLTITSEDCRSMLGRLAKEFDKEFKIDAKVITFADQVGSASGLTFQYGQDNGLYQLSRKNVDSKNTVTRVFGFGSTQNLPNDYRSGFNQLVFDAKYLEDTSEYPDVVEGEITFNDIKPSFEGAITTVAGTNNITISVASMDFDLEAQLNSGVTAKVVFNSGDLLGQQFEILDNSYVDGTKTFTLVSFDDATGTTYPNATFKPLVGDLITFIDIHMPASYITAAEVELQAATQTYLDQNKKLRVTYDLTFDERYTDAQNLDIGDTVILIDTDFGVNRTIRITSLVKKFDGSTLKSFKGTISDYIPINVEQLITSSVVDSQKDIVINEAQGEDLARRNTLKNRNLKDLVFDPDDFFDTDNIRPLSIETLFLSVGAKSQNFRLANITIQANFESDENRIKLSAGTLYHRVVERVSPAGSTWTMSALDQSSLTPATDYFVYAKCSKTATTGTYLVSSSQLAADPDDGFYYFWIGILYAVVDGVRDFDLTNGMTYINGRTITTGRIRSLNELNYFDLDLNLFKLGSAQSDNVNLTGTNGTANITGVGGLTKLVTFTSSLPTSAANFVTSHAAAYAALPIPIIVTSTFSSIIFNSVEAYVVPRITNVTGDLDGGVVNTIVGSSIDWNVSASNALTLINASIKASSIEGGSLDIGDGDFTVDEDGNLNIGSGVFTVDKDGALVSTSATIKSSASNQRIEIDSSTNTLKFYNSAGTLKAALEANGTNSYFEADLIRSKILLYVDPIASIPGGLPADNHFWQDNSGNLYFINTNGTQTQLN